MLKKWILSKTKKRNLSRKWKKRQKINPLKNLKERNLLHIKWTSNCLKKYKILLKTKGKILINQAKSSKVMAMEKKRNQNQRKMLFKMVEKILHRIAILVNKWRQKMKIENISIWMNSTKRISSYQRRESKTQTLMQS